MPSEKSQPWYADGLRFSCHGCNNCCRGAQPGFVYVSPRQIERIARWLEMSASAFRKRYVTKDEGGDAVLTMHDNGDCIFWKGGCTIYPARPRQCRTFPFWPENLVSPEAYDELSSFCHGTGRGKLYPLEDIRAVLHGRGTSSGS